MALLRAFTGHQSRATLPNPEWREADERMEKQKRRLAAIDAAVDVPRRGQ